MRRGAPFDAALPLSAACEWFPIRHAGKREQVPRLQYALERFLLQTYARVGALCRRTDAPDTDGGAVISVPVAILWPAASEEGGAQRLSYRVQWEGSHETDEFVHRLLRRCADGTAAAMDVLVSHLRVVVGRGRTARAHRAAATADATVPAVGRASESAVAAHAAAPACVPALAVAAPALVAPAPALVAPGLVVAVPAFPAPAPAARAGVPLPLAALPTSGVKRCRPAHLARDGDGLSVSTVEASDDEGSSRRALVSAGPRPCAAPALPRGMAGRDIRFFSGEVASCTSQAPDSQSSLAADLLPALAASPSSGFWRLTPDGHRVPSPNRTPTIPLR